MRRQELQCACEASACAESYCILLYLGAAVRSPGMVGLLWKKSHVDCGGWSEEIQGEERAPSFCSAWAALLREGGNVMSPPLTLMAVPLQRSWSLGSHLSEGGKELQWWRGMQKKKTRLKLTTGPLKIYKIVNPDTCFIRSSAKKLWERTAN